MFKGISPKVSQLTLNIFTRASVNGRNTRNKNKSDIPAFNTATAWQAVEGEGKGQN